jgi:hypothetical protein
LQDALRDRWKKAQWMPGCLVNFGATVTRLVADTVPGAGSIKARNQRMAFALRVRGIDGAGDPTMTAFIPDPENLSYGKLAMLRAAGVTGRGNVVAWKDAFRLIETSSGYPVAFQPLSIAFCTRLDGTRDTPIVQRTCAQQDSAVVLDGGLFDNGPIALAYSLYFETHQGYRLPTAIYLSPDRRRVWVDQRVDVTGTPSSRRQKVEPHGLESLTQLAREAFPTARQYELAFAGRMLPAELARRDAQTRLDALARTNIELIEELERRRTLHAYEADTLRATVARLCHDYRPAQTDTAARVHQSCLKLAAADTAMPPRPVVVQQGSGPLARARHRADSLRAITSIDSRFRSTERWHPLAGDWLAGFGAFLARPLREYDFYVGMYDAFVLLAENGQCDAYRAAFATAPTRAANDAFRTCLADVLPQYFDRPPIELGPIAPHILRELYTAEFKTTLPALPRPLEPRDDSALTVIRAVNHAMYAARMVGGKTVHVGRADRLKPAPGHCTRSDAFQRIFCESGVVAFFDRLSAHRDAVAIMEQWSKAESCHERRWDRPHLCRTERAFVDMIDDPEGELYRLTRAMLARLETVTPEKSGARIVASGLVAIHGAVSDRHRRGADLGPSSVPRNANRSWRTFLMFLPNSAMLTPNVAGWGELTWEFRRHLGESPYALTVPVHARIQSEIAKAGPFAPHGSMTVPGLRLEHKDIGLATRVGVEVDAWLMNEGVLPNEYLGHTFGVFMSLLGRFNVSWTTVPGDLTYYRERARIRVRGTPTILTLGLGDLRGVVYWGRRVLF